MIKNYIKYFLPLSIALFSTLTSCKKVFKEDNFVAYFGGEVLNPQEKYVLFLKDDEVIDTIYLDKNNRFMHKFDSLAPGLYSFKHDPEYQYVYFDKNDSLMVRVNTFDFDNSVVFCGRGDEKNNFLMELYLKNEADRSLMYDNFDKDVKSFIKNIDSSFAIRKSFYLKRKAEIGWDENFDLVAKACLDFHHITKKEIYPYAHQFRTGENIRTKLPSNYYEHRKEVDFENTLLTNYSPFIKYVSVMLNNVALQKDHLDLNENSLENNIEKLNITDTLIKSQKVKNVVLNNVAMMYLLEDQNMYNNQKFIERYLQLTTDAKNKKEITEIYNSVQNLKVGNRLPKIDLIDTANQPIDINNIIKKPTILFFWTSHAESHFVASHKKITDLKAKYPEYEFIAVNVNDTKINWENALKKYNFEDVNELHAVDFETIRKQWVITKIHRIIILKADGTIKNGFANLFDVNFEQNLK
ncbi:TlpA family protein disulfide reductase [Flavobacterium lacisediminis]|uniref:Thioredoxin family protein n=1 Tax=Flavobacterium lacisediminis TaxID=2989705 RepID=A0ABT3EIS8_9FLAO|nr:thioredoxin family protein [Flavobacterium lacisediminis]MCW1148477.1 thioredoxin family protein [Flavobacterium lacisediminis]